jgi:hypothetical protein
LDANLIDITESFAAKMDLSFSRIDSNEITILLKEQHPGYILSVILKSDYDIIYFSCDINIYVPANRYVAITDAIVKTNERIWLGHFDLISSVSRIVYSLAIPFISSQLINEEIIESTIQMITDECNRFYNYFFIVVQNEKLFDISSNTLFLESAGEA